MKLAARMDRILIESAFGVLVKARALDAQGRHIVRFANAAIQQRWWIAMAALV